MEPDKLTGYKIVFVTAPVDEAPKIAQVIIEKKLAACANIIENIKSIYWWQNKIQNDTESLIIFKTDYRNVNNLIKEIKSIHSYTIPEIVAVDIETGNPDYFKWITESLLKI